MLSLLSFQAFAQETSPWTNDYCVMDGVATIQGLQCLIGNLLGIAIPALGFIAFIMLVVSAFRWQLSGGNSKGKETARNTMTFVVVGIVVAISSFIILNLIASFTGVSSILDFTIPAASPTP